ncbi:xanthine dehydrogenase/oxidase-like [Plakobranchus ocellatus]|uniref:Xanthine dehydrogenase/oxidase-like n=1 Tax=Plakobranchus ocellatus TaxID=259542 RepID=A0AAV4CFD1_9GAST|nr:xanthine dehydrogenase/oxidase-like [Plakobranchus ocellatus]
MAESYFANEQNYVSSMDPDTSCVADTTRAHEEDNSNISNPSLESVVNKNHAVGRDAGSQHDDASNDQVDSGEADQADATEVYKVSAPEEISTNQAENVYHLDDENENTPTAMGKSESNLEHQIDINRSVYNLTVPLKSNEKGDSTPKAANLVISEEADDKTNQTSDSIQDMEIECSNEGAEKFNVESLSYELQVGYRILNNMMSASNKCVNKMFLHPVDDKFPETASYYEKIKKPMWMLKMKEKFESHQYEDITEFMADFRLMIENCYRFNGPDNFVSKKALKLETMMKQKVALLSKNLRDKIMGAAGPSSDDDLLTSAGLRRRIRNPNVAVDDPSQQLLSQLRKDRELQEKVDRRQKVEDRRAMEQARLQELQDWEDRIIGPDIKEHIKTMWELPQIGLFVYLCMESLGLEEEVTQYQIERGLAMPRECSDFRRLMTCLLSTPHQRKNLKSFMPYHVWNSKLTEKLDNFYKVLSEKNGNHTQACYKLGFDLRAFKMMGKVNPMRKKKFHELTFLKRVWILKSYCDFCLETQQYLQKTIEDIEAVRPNDVREVLLGSDGRGYRYINFPMFTGKDIRIFKHQKLGEPTLESLCMEDWSVETEKPSASSSRCSTPINQRNGRQAETPLNSLRARALLQAAESKEASPFRDSSRAGSESMETSVSLSQHPSSDNLDNIQPVNSVKPLNPKKRKKTSIFSGKKKRFKTKKMESSFGSTASADETKVEEDSLIENDFQNNSVCGESPLKNVIMNGGTTVACDIVPSEKRHKPSAGPCTSLSESDNEISAAPSNGVTVTTREGDKRVLADATSTTEIQEKADMPKSLLLKKEENLLPSHDAQQDKQLDSAYLSCESDKSGRDEEELKLGDGPVLGNKIEHNTMEHSPSGHQESLENLVNGTEEKSTSYVKGSTIKVKEEVLDKDVEDIEKTGVLAKKEETLQEEEVQNPLENVGVDSDKAKPYYGEKKFFAEDVAEKPKELKNHDLPDVVEKSIFPNLECSTKCEELQSHISELGDTVSIGKNAAFPNRPLFNGVCNKENSSGHEAMNTPDIGVNTTKEDEVNGCNTKSRRGKEDAKGFSQCEDSENIKSPDRNDREETYQKNAGTEENISKPSGEYADRNEEEEEETDEDEDDLPERGRIELVAESMEDIRQLMNKLSNPDPIKRGKKVYPGVIKPCEEELLANLTRFHDDLLKFEKSLTNARAGMQVKLRKEVDNYTEPKVEETKGWDSDHSRSTKDSSEDEEDEGEEPDSKAEMESSRKSKRIKAKQQVAATTSLLTSAASKLSVLSDNGNNEDSNDSFEIDISSRGRLRKRRIIPNNTEDTGLRKRKLMDLVVGTSANDVPCSVSVSSATSLAPSTLASIISLPTVIQRQPGKPLPSHILSMLTSGGLTSSSSAIRTQLLTTKAGSSPGLQQHLLAGQVFRLVTPGRDSSAAPGSVIISPQNLASIRFVSSTGVVTLPRERILSAGSSSASTSSSSSAQASHPVIQQLLLNKSAKGQALTTKVSFVPKVTVNSGAISQTSQQQHQQSVVSNSTSSKMSVIVTLPSVSSALNVHHHATSNRSSVIRSPMVMVTPQSSTKLGGVASAGPVVVSQVSSTMSGGKQVLDLGSLSVSQIQQLMRNQAIQINMGGTEGGPTTLLLTTGLQQVGASAGSNTGKEVSPSTASLKNTTSAGPPSAIFQQQQQLHLQQQVQQVIRPGVAVTGASSLLAMINNKGQKLMAFSPTSTATSNVFGSSIKSGQLLSGHSGLASHDIQVALKGATNTSPAQQISNSALKSALNNRTALPESFLTSNIVSSTIASIMTALGSARTSVSSAQSARSVHPMPRIISSLSPTAPVTTATLAPNTKEVAITGVVGKDSQQKSRTIITVPLVHLSSPKKYASNVTVKALLENRAPKKSDSEELVKNALLNNGIFSSTSTSNSSMPKPQESLILSDSQPEEGDPHQKENTPDLSSQSPSVLTSLTMPLSINTGGSSGLECATSEVIVPTVHIKVPSPNTLPSVLHNKNGTTIVQSTKVPIAVASEAKAPDTASPSTSSLLVSGQSNIASLSTPQAVKTENILPGSSMVQVSPTSGSVSGVSPQHSQQQGIKNVMLKVTPQSGGSGQFVQGYMTSKGLVIPQSALVQHQQGKNVILANSSGVSQASVNLPVQQTGLNILGQPGATIIARQPTPNQNQPQQQVQVLGSSSALALPSQLQKGTVINSGGLKFMLVNPLGQGTPAVTVSQQGQQAASVVTNMVSHQALASSQQQQPQTSTPAAELVKQIAANSIQVQSSCAFPGLLSAQPNTALNPRIVQKSGDAVRAQPGVVRMSTPSVVSSSTPRTTGPAVQQIGVGTGGILSGQGVVGSNISPSNITPQLAAQLLALQQQQQGMVLAGGKPVTVSQQQNRLSTPSVVTLQLQQLGQLFSSLSQLQPGNMQQQQQQQQQQSIPTGSLAGGQQSGQVVQLSLNPGQTFLAGATNPQTQQLAKMSGGQVSPQIQLPTGQLQVSQGSGLVLNQPQAQLTSQNVLLQQKPLHQPSVVVSTGINLQQHTSSLQQQQQQQQQTNIIKLAKQATPVSVVKPQLSALPSSQPALQVVQQQQQSGVNMGTNGTSSSFVSLSPSQNFVMSSAVPASVPGNQQQQQQQVQFVLNPSSLGSLPMATGVSPLSTLNKLPGGNIRRVIRADSSVLQTSLTTSPTLTQTGNISSPAIVIGSSSQAANNAQLTGGKQALTQMILPTSVGSSGQFLISPMKLGASPQANIISPLKLIGGLQVGSSVSASGQGTQILMNNNQLPGTVLGKPSVIYAGQPNQVQANMDKNDSNMAHVLLNQSNGNLLQVHSAQINKEMNAPGSLVNNSQRVLIRSAGQILQTPRASQMTQLPPNGNVGNPASSKTTFLYKVGNQYFSPAVSNSQLGSVTSSLQSIPAGSALLSSSLPVPVSKPDVQLLVPPACIEASEKILLQNSKNATAPSSGKPQHLQTHSDQTPVVTSSLPNAGAVNGTHFSFSLSGPTTVGKPQAARPADNTSQVINGQTPHQEPENTHLKNLTQSAVLLRDDNVGKKQISSIPTSGGDAASVSNAGSQQHIVSGATGDEKEAAMNLLTLANQAL